MIHNSSSDPVLIKKISLKIWSLRDEIESRIQDKLEANPETTEADLNQIKEFYTPQAPLSNNVLTLKSNTELDTGEDEMARAMAEAEKEEAEAVEVEAASPEVVPIETVSSDNIVSIDKNIITLNLEAAKIADEKIAKGKTVLSEISMEKMFFFCNKPFTEGQSIVIQFCIPNSFIVNADILYCRPFNLKSRIISQNNYTHRALIRFNFLKEGQRALLRQFLQSIEPDLSKISKKTSSAKKESSESEFGELDDLGL